MKKTFYIEQLGCAKNQVDGEIMAGALLAKGWEAAGEASSAGVVLVNTCGFIQSAQEESLQTLLAFTQEHDCVVATGCLSQRWAENLTENIPELAGCFGNRKPEDIGTFLEEKLPAGFKVWRPEGNDADTDLVYRQRPLHGFPFSAYVKISEGCDHHCTYCAIPLIRGHQRDRPLKAVAAEVENLLARGVKEINLVAHDLANYGPGLISLIKLLDTYKGKWWLRLLYIYPETFPLEILDLMKTNTHLVRYLDIPFQHGSDSLLKIMGRKSRRKDLENLVSKIRFELPDLALRTTFITGFRGESKADFQELLEFQKTIQPEWSGIFAYSPQEGTPAELNPKTMGKLPPKSKVLERKNAFEEAQNLITAGRLSRFIGSIVEVLIEELLEERGTALGRTPFQAPDVDGLTVVRLTRSPLAKPGDIIKVFLEGVTGVDLRGREINDKSELDKTFTNV